MNPIAITPTLANSLRESQQYFLELVMTPDDPSQPLTEKLDISGIVRDTYMSRGGSQIFTFTIADYFIKHTPDFTEVDRVPLVVSCEELQRSRSRYLSVLTADAATSLQGSSLAIVKDLPTSLTFRIGKINLEDASDTAIYPPNVTNPIPGQTDSPNQYITHVLVRFGFTVQYLTETHAK